MQVRTSFRAPQYDVSQFARLHSRRKAAESAKFALAGTIVKGLAQIKTVTDSYRDEKELQDFRVQSTLAESSFMQNYGNKVTFTSDEVLEVLSPESAETMGLRLTEKYTTDDGAIAERPRQDIPKYEVFPSMYMDYMNKNIPIWAESITDDRQRQMAVGQAELLMQPKAIRIASEAVASQRNTMRQSVDLDVQKLKDRGEFDAAHNRIESAIVLTKEEKKAKRMALYKDEEKGFYANLRSVGNMDDMVPALNKLSLPHEEYVKQDGKLSEVEKNTQKSYMQREIDSVDRVKRTENKARLTETRRQARKAAEEAFHGTPRSIEQVRDLMTVLYASGEPTDYGIIKELQTAQHFAGTAQRMNMTGVRPGDAIMDLEMAHIAKTAVNPAAIKKKLMAETDRKARALRDDPVNFGRQFYPIPRFNPNGIFNAEKPGAAFIAAQRTEIEMMRAYDVTDAFLSKSDWYDFRQFYDTLSLSEKTAVLNEAVTVFGEDTERFFESGIGKDAGPMAVVGMISAENMEGAKIVLQGQQLQTGGPDGKSPPVRIPKDFDSAARDRLGGAFGSADISAQRLSAVRAAYAFYAHQEYGLGGTDLETADEKILDKALAATTKGIIEYNNAVFEAPSIDVNARDFTRYIENLSYKHWDREGGFVGITSKQVKKGLDDGTFTFRRVGSGKYNIVTQDGLPLESGANPGSAFVFDYNSDPYTVDEAMAHEKDDAYRDDLVNPDKMARQRDKRINQFMNRMQFGGI